MNRKVSIQWKDHLPYRHKSMVKPFHLLRKRHYHQIYWREKRTINKFN